MGARAARPQALAADVRRRISRSTTDPSSVAITAEGGCTPMDTDEIAAKERAPENKTLNLPKLFRAMLGEES